MHQHRAACVDGAGDFTMFVQQFGGLIGCKTPELMAAGDHTQGAVVFGAVIKMDTDGQHLLKDRNRRLDMGYTIFDGPWAEARCVDALFDRDCLILVPGHLPVRVLGFVEIDGAHSKSAAPKYRINKTSDLRLIDDPGKIGQHLKQVADRVDRSTGL